MMEHLGASGRPASSLERRLIYFSSVPFATYAQRPHFMVDAFAEGGFDSVLWVDPYPTRFPTWADLLRVGSKNDTVPCPRSGSIKVVRPVALPIEPLPGSGPINGFLSWRKIRAEMTSFASGAQHCVLAVGRPSKLAEWALEHLPHARSLVDVLDNFPAFYRGLSRMSMKARLNAVCRKATDVYCSSSRIAEDVGRVRADALVVLNGYCTDHLPEPSPAEQRRYIGYVGSIAEWFDWPLVCTLAASLPDVTIRLIGPEFVSRPSDLPANIEFLGARPQPDIANLVREFAVGLIPFRINDLTAGVDPIKYYEYRSMGLPVWSTLFGEMRSRHAADGVAHISQRTDWRHLWMQEQSAAVPSFESVKAFRREIDWKQRFAPIVARSRIPASEESKHAGCTRRSAAVSPPRP
jgi:glycosyltransferase involved in cell wall biosynthesis